MKNREARDMAEKQQPWGKWYWGDWRKDARLRRCCYAARGLWADMLSLMGGECDRFGYLMMEGQALGAGDLVGLLGGSEREVSKLLTELDRKRVFSRTGDADMEDDLKAIVAADLPVGVIFSRRMLRDKAKIERDRANGKGGGNPNLKPADNGGVNPPDKAQSQKPEPKPAVATAELQQADANEMNRLNRLLAFDERDHRAFAANIRTLIDLKAEGCDFARHIFPAAERAARGGSAKRLSYIVASARELRDADRTVSALPTAFVQVDMQGWRDRLKVWRRSGTWTETWGPKPGEVGCKCPPEIINAEIAA